MIFDPLLPFTETSSILKNLSANFEYRPQQFQMAGSVKDALEKKEIILIEAPTGVGKTLAYLIPLLHHSLGNQMRVAVSTETRSLQKQILENEIPTAEKILHEKINAEICMGAANYVCKKKLNELIQSGNIDTVSSRYLNDFLDWENTTDSGLLPEYTGRVSDQFRRSVSRDADVCLGKRCPNFDVSFYFKAREKWKNADLLIMNHSLLASHIALEGKLLPEFQFLVIDEAHRFPEIFQKSMELSFDFINAEKLLNDSRFDEGSAFFQKFKEEIIAKYFLLPGQSIRLKKSIESDTLFSFINTLNFYHDDLSHELEENSETEFPENLTSLIIVKKEIQNLLLLMNALSSDPGETRVHWLERTSDEKKINYRMHVIPVKSGPLIRKMLLDKLDSVILTSATLTTGSFSYFAGELGCRIESTQNSKINDPARISALKLSSPFNYKKNLLFYIPRQMPDPSSDEKLFFKAVADELIKLIKLTDGGAFVLFTSIKSLNAVHEILKNDFAVSSKIISQTEFGPHTALERFSKEKDSVLFGLSSFWQGIDIPGDALRLVIIVRIPFQVPDTPLLEAKMELAKKQSINPFMNIQLPHSIILMKQGAGRLIRTGTDRGITAILDPRIRTKSYGKNIIQALPETDIINDFVLLEKKYRNLFTDLIQ